MEINTAHCLVAVSHPRDFRLWGKGGLQDLNHQGKDTRTLSTGTSVPSVHTDGPLTEVSDGCQSPCPQFPLNNKCTFSCVPLNDSGS